MADRKDLEITYIAEPVGAKFHAGTEFVRGVMGPIGSGKSVMCVQEIFRLGCEQRPGKDGIRRSRWALIRNTYPELKSTTIKTYLDWFGPIQTIKYDAPIVSTLEVNDVWMEWYFLSLDKEKDIGKLKSLELTGAFLNEASELPKAVLDMATGRVGRYPAKREGGATRPCLILDTNPPDDDHWWYRLFEEERPENYAIYKQPPALLKIPGKNGPVYVPNPEAENIRNLEGGYQYYLRQIPGKKEEWIDVFVRGQYGTSEAGRPCYPSFDDSVHVADKPLAPFPDIPLLLGWDYGRTPVCIIGQMSPRGQFRVLDEIIVEAEGPGMGIRKFTREVVKPYLDTHYPGFAFQSWGDPAGSARSQKVEENCYELQAQEGIPTETALSNDITYRLENVDYFLLRMVDGQPGFLLSPTCKMLRRGFKGGYQFERVQVAGDARYKDQPAKNRYSHPHDALQYLADLAKNGITKATSGATAQPVVDGVSAAGWT
jgi:hypothetical protein